jgi:hypothetical protein
VVCGQTLDTVGQYNIICPGTTCDTVFTIQVQRDTTPLFSTRQHNLCATDSVVGCGGQLHTQAGVYLDTCFLLPKVCGVWTVQQLTVVDASIQIQNLVIQHPSNSTATNGSAFVTATGGSGALTYTWYNQQGQVINNTPNLTGAASGLYTLEIHDQTGCRVIRSVFLSSLLENEELESRCKMAVVPNPASHAIRIICNDVQEPANVQIYSSDGRLLHEVNAYTLDTELDLSGLPFGLLYARIRLGSSGTEVLRFVHME